MNQTVAGPNHEPAATGAATSRLLAAQWLTVNLGDRSYPIAIGQGLRGDTALFQPYVQGRQVALVSNDTVAPLYAQAMAHTLRLAGARHVLPVILPDGEAYKDLAHFEKILASLLEARFDRKCVLVALGGGVVGDMTGFAAACYQRGVDFIQIPTTLLAQVDSSVGGKTAVNHPLGKNMIGAFYQPRLVVCDLETLRTLPPRELTAGLAEVIKYGAMADAAFFDQIEADLAAMRALDLTVLGRTVLRSCAIKAEVVGADEREGGLRATLNFGHTFGHAIEGAMGYGNWLHGEAVGCGMVIAADLSRRLGLLGQQEVERLRSLVAAAGLPVVAPGPSDMSLEAWLSWMAVDKKSDAGRVRFVLLSALGKSLLRTVPEDLLLATLEAASRP